MSDRATSPASGKRRRRHRGNSDPPPKPPVLPQWSLEVLRPVVHKLSRLLWHISFKGVENIPQGEGGLIVAANHQTYIDPFWVAIPLKRPMRFLAWDEAFDWPVAGKMMQLFGAWPLQIEGGDPAAIRRTLQWLKGGGAVMIFPEGRRALADGSMSDFKMGAARIALESGAPVLPVTIRGGHQVWPRRQSLPRLGRIEIIYHPTHRPAPRPGEDARQCARRESEWLSALIKSAL